MTKSQIAEKVVKDFTAATNNNSGVLPTPFSSVLEAPVSFNPYDLKGKDYWKVNYIRRDYGYCREVGTIDVDSETVANELASILSAQGYDEVVVEFHDKDLPF